MMTLSILSYAKLPSINPTICIIDSPEIANGFTQTIAKQESKYSALSISSKDTASTNCNVLFFSKTTPANEYKTINEAPNKMLLSFSINNDDCEIGSVFCLYKTKSENTRFKVNLDSLTKSKIHVDPRVLLLARNVE